MDQLPCWYGEASPNRRLPVDANDDIDWDFGWDATRTKVPRTGCASLDRSVLTLHYAGAARDHIDALPTQRDFRTHSADVGRWIDNLAHDHRRSGIPALDAAGLCEDRLRFRRQKFDTYCLVWSDDGRGQRRGCMQRTQSAMAVHQIVRAFRQAIESEAARRIDRRYQIESSDYYLTSAARAALNYH